MVVQAGVRVRHRGCVTERFSGDTVMAQISGERGSDVFVLRGRDEAAVDDALRASEDYVGRRAEVIGRTPTCVVFRGANPPSGVIQVIRASPCTILWPIVYRDREEFYTLLAPSRGALRGLVADLGSLGEVQVERLAEVPPEGVNVSASFADLTASLTQRQLSALVLAMERGYYDSPRGTTSAALAKAMGIGRTTYGEHLRKAEQRVLGHFARMLATHSILGQAARRRPGRPPSR